MESQCGTGSDKLSGRALRATFGSPAALPGASHAAHSGCPVLGLFPPFPPTSCVQGERQKGFYGQEAPGGAGHFSVCGEKLGAVRWDPPTSGLGKTFANPDRIPETGPLPRELEWEPDIGNPQGWLLLHRI